MDNDDDDDDEDDLENESPKRAEINPRVMIVTCLVVATTPMAMVKMKE